MSKIIKVKCQMSKINKVIFDGAYLRSSSGHFSSLQSLQISNNTILQEITILKHKTLIYQHFRTDLKSPTQPEEEQVLNEILAKVKG